ncbi:MAG: glucosaminidase domain-containing protein [Butyribacter sp.]|nr:glucosaminidase domain-containing protein [bacterium]MDY3854717.1 glucosaminidase domain-containing protein [Butyribacter sp.]
MMRWIPKMQKKNNVAKTLLFSMLCVAILIGTLDGCQTAFVKADEAAENTVPDSICTINGTDSGAILSEKSITYNDAVIDVSETPLVTYNGVTMMALRQTICSNGPKVSYEYNKKTKHVRLVWQNKVITFYVGDTTLYVNGQKYVWQTAPEKVVYTASGKSGILVPAEQLCNALAFSCQWNSEGTVMSLTKNAVRFSGQTKKTAYPYSLKKYAKAEYRRSPKVSYKTYRKLVDTKQDITQSFQYLRVDRYRSVDKKKFKQYYQYLIEDYCREAGISTKKSSLYNKADVFLKAAKKYKLDPVYLVCQTFLESAYGTSRLASGNTIKKIAYRSFARKKNGKFKTKKLKSKRKVYNLYGIKAYDSDPFVGATSYAYYKKWTTVNKAIYGAASYLSKNYVHSRYKQNTIFKMRFSPNRKTMWHQYATDPYYAQKIGLRMYWMSTCYAGNTTFIYDYPKYK